MQSIRLNNAQEINRLWSEIYSLWKQEETNKSQSHLDKECNKVIDIYSKLLDLIGKEANPHDYFFVLRKRAQNYGLIKNFDNALEDLYEEADYAWKKNDQLRIKECQELISQISVWHTAMKGNVGKAI